MTFPARPRLRTRTLWLTISSMLAMVLIWQARPKHHALSTGPSSHVGQDLPSVNTQAAEALEPVLPAQCTNAFDAWLVSYGKGNSTSLEQGISLARSRRIELRELIHNDPAEAISRSYSQEFILSLPREVQANMETWIDARGSLRVLAQCDGTDSSMLRLVTVGQQTYRVHSAPKQPLLQSREDFPVRGIAIDGELALLDAPSPRVKTLSSQNKAASSNPGDYAMTETVYQAYSTEGQVSPKSSPVLTTEQASTAPDAPLADPAWVMGEKRILWIMVDFSDAQGAPVPNADIQKMVDEASTFYSKMSRGGSTLKLTLHPKIFRSSYKRSQISPTDLFAQGLPLMDQAVADARAYDLANGGTGLYNPDNYDRWVVHFKIDNNTRAFASVGTKGMCFRGPALANRLTHELGHNMGLQHAKAWKPSTNSPIGAGTQVEYGDIYDNMGDGDLTMPFNGAEKYPLGFLSREELSVVAAPWVDESAPWEQTVRLYRSDIQEAGRPQSARILATIGSNLAYWADYLPRSGNSQNGVQLRWHPAPSFVPGSPGGLPYSSGTHLLDMTPQSSGDMGDASLQVGKTFTDTEQGVTITALSKGGSANAEYIEAKIHFGATGSNQNPEVSLSGVPPLRARTLVSFQAQASDANGDAITYRWFQNGQLLSPVSNQLSTAWMTGGSCRLQVQALDGKGGVGFKTLSFEVEDPLQSWVRPAQVPAIQSQDYTDVLYAADKFIVTGFYGALMYSTDGDKWRPAVLPKGFGWPSLRAAHHDGTHFWAVGTKNLSGTNYPLILRSEDGISWTEIPAGITSGTITDICSGEAGWVCVGWNNLILHSTDGLEWKQVTSLGRPSLNAVGFHRGRYVAVGSSGALMTSTNGRDWESRTLAGSPNQTTLFIQDDQWQATNIYPGSVETRTSSDGLEWTKKIDTAENTHTCSIADANGFHYSLTTSDILRISGLDGLKATIRLPSITNSKSTRAFAQGNGLSVVVGTSDLLLKAGSPIKEPVETPPSFIRQPISIATSPGQSVTFSTSVRSSLPVTYSWSKNGVRLAGATGPSLHLPKVGAGDIGSYVLSATNEFGTTQSTAVRLLFADARLTNLSVRSTAGSATSPLIIGYSVSNGDKQLLGRAVGPTLKDFGITTPLPDPVMDLYRESHIVASNDNWFSQDFEGRKALFASVGAFSLPNTSLDAAIVAKLTGVHTVWVYDKQDRPGITLMELYDTESLSSTAALVNISAKNLVKSGDGTLIAGFVISGKSELTLLIRGIGPALTAFGVTGALADPLLELHGNDAQGVDQILASNDDWGSEDRAISMREIFSSVGAFDLTDPTGKDAALLVTLPPGSYSALVKPKNGAVGQALVEVYVIP